MIVKNISVVALLLMLFGDRVMAVEFPTVSGVLAFEMDKEHAINLAEDDGKASPLMGAINVELDLAFSEELFVLSEGVLESVGDHGLGRYGFYIEGVTLNYERDRWGVFGGKYNPDFSIGSDALSGIFAGDLIDYELEQRIGLGGYYRLNDAVELRFSSFFADTTFLNQTYLYNVERLSLADGGVSNTEDFSSYALGLYGEVGGFEYHIGFVNQAAGVDDTADEKSASVGVIYVYEGAVTLMPVIEFARQKNFEGELGVDIDYLTVGIDIDWNQYWQSSLSQTWRGTRNLDAEGVNDTLVQLGVEYQFDERASVELGWKSVKVEEQRLDSLGFLFVYEVAF